MLPKPPRMSIGGRVRHETLTHWYCNWARPAYGGVFIVLSVAWGALVDRVAPDRFDLLGTVIGLLGVAVIMYWPR
jgi:drug/metabolite transporter superfamily protein YnfA